MSKGKSFDMLVAFLGYQKINQKKLIYYGLFVVITVGPVSIKGVFIHGLETKFY